jgi:uncharacterized protein YndB with AHSA1/START domain
MSGSSVEGTYVEGTYVEIDGCPAVRFVRSYPHPIERVWSAVATSEGLAHWFPSAVTIDLRVGGSVTFSGDPAAEDGSGVVLACEPPHRLIVTWGRDELRFELESLTDGGCRFTLVNVLERRDAAARNAAGWSVCLTELDRHVAGEAVGGPHSDGAVPWQPLYERYLAAGLPSGAPIGEPG